MWYIEERGRAFSISVLRFSSLEVGSQQAYDFSSSTLSRIVIVFVKYLWRGESKGHITGDVRKSDLRGLNAYDFPQTW